MFGFLKKKLGQAMSTFTKKVAEQTEDASDQKSDATTHELSTQDQGSAQKPKATPIPEAAKPVDGGSEPADDEPPTRPATRNASQARAPSSRAPQEQRRDAASDEQQSAPDSLASERKGVLQRLRERITHTSLSDERFEELFWDLEVALLESNVAMEVIEKIKEDLRAELTSDRIIRRSAEQIVHDRLRTSINEVLSVPSLDLLAQIRTHKPYTIAFIGVNGSGKTTSMAKLAHTLQEHGLSVVMAAADTFRAAAIQQLEEHANRLKVKLIKQQYGSDPAAVAYDAIAHAKAQGIDVVLIDTAGRLHSNDNLMKELHKLIRVNNPDLKLFVAEATTGNDAVEQAKVFDEAIGIDAIILAKADVDEKGGAAISIAHVTGKPILYLGTGQGYTDLKPFDKERILATIGL